MSDKIFKIKKIQEQCKDHNGHLDVTFIDFKQAKDYVKWKNVCPNEGYGIFMIRWRI